MGSLIRPPDESPGNGYEAMNDLARRLREWQPEHRFFIGIDSDGCVFDSMEIKHKECFIPNTIRHWSLQPVARYAREAAEFVNLYSRWRGINRWPALVMVLDLLRERPEVQRRGAHIPAADTLRAFATQTRYPLSNDGLLAFMRDYPAGPELKTALAWSRAVDEAVAAMVRGVPPFPAVRESLAALCARADLIVASATPTPALEREWREHDLARFVRFICGQETGTKGEILRLAAGGKYPILLIGDAPGDRDAAKSVDVLYYPINPGAEDASWKRFHNEALGKFLDGTYAGTYEEALIAEFEKLLPETPPWQKLERIEWED